LSLITILEITLARITPPHWEASARDIQKSLIIRSDQTTLGGKCKKKKSSMIKGAPTKLGGMKKNPKDPKILSKKKTNTMMLKTK
jgi:hypothetical protein